MKILIFHNTLFAQYKSIYFDKIYQNLKESGGELLVIQTSYSESYRFNHFNKKDLEKTINYPYLLISKKPLEKVSSIFEFYYWIKYILKFKPNILNLTGYNSPFTLPILLICKLLNIKTIITLESIRTPNNQKYFRKLLKTIILKNTDFLNSYGINTNNYLFSLGVPKSKIIKFSNTFDKSKFSNLPPIKNNRELVKLLFIGRLSHEKNLINTIIYLSKIEKIKIQFDIYGDGPLELPIRNLIKENNLNFVHLKGSIKWANIDSIYPLYDYFLLLSSNEPWGMVANEANFFYLPVICSANCGCANDLIISNFNGLILNNPIENEKIEYLENYLLNHSNSTKFIQRNNLIFDEKFAINKYLEKLYLLNEK